MRKLSEAHRRFLGFALAVVLAVTLSHTSNAQLTGQLAGQQTNRAPDETIEIEAGEVFEILAHSDDPTANAVWVLTQDRTFVEAARSKVFRTRQVNPGEYLLDATITEPMLSTETRRIFLLRIIPHKPKDPAAPSMMGNDLVMTTPATQQGVVTLPKNFHVMRFTPDQTNTAHFAVVLDATAAQAQPDNLDTYSYNEASGIFVWFALPRDRMMEVAIQRKDGTIARSQLQLKIGEEENVVSSQGIVANAREDGTIRFALETPPRAGLQTIALWDFGDGQQSLITSPSHKYMKNGTYTVRVSVRDILNGTVVSTAQTTINVTGINETGSGATTVSSSSSSAQSSVPSTGEPSTGFWATMMQRLNSTFARTILIIVGIIVLLGLLVLVVLRLLRRSKLDKTLEDAESLLLKKTATQAVIDAPATPLQVKRAPKEEVQEISLDDLPKEEEPIVLHETPPPTTEPHIDEDAAPAWLKKGLGAAATTSESPKQDKQEVVETTVVEPVATPVPEPDDSSAEALAKEEPEPVIETPAPVTETIAPPVVESTPATEEVTPPWLQPQAEPVSEPTPAPQAIVETEPQPVAAPAPVAQTPAPAPSPSPKDDARAEREREKRRLKRQRYRQNLKTREQEKKASAPQPAPVAPAPAPVSAPVVPEPVITPEPEPVVAPTPVVPEPVMSLPPENFAEELPAAEPKTELPAAQPSRELPAANPATELPAPVQTPIQPAAPSLAEPPVTPTSSDEDVKFIIRADSVGQNPEDPQT